MRWVCIESDKDSPYYNLFMRYIKLAQILALLTYFPVFAAPPEGIFLPDKDFIPVTLNPVKQKSPDGSTSERWELKTPFFSIGMRSVPNWTKTQSNDGSLILTSVFYPEAQAIIKLFPSISVLPQGAAKNPWIDSHLAGLNLLNLYAKKVTPKDTFGNLYPIFTGSKRPTVVGRHDYELQPYGQPSPLFVRESFYEVYDAHHVFYLLEFQFQRSSDVPQTIFQTFFESLSQASFQYSYEAP